MVDSDEVKHRINIETEALEFSNLTDSVLKREWLIS